MRTAPSGQDATSRSARARHPRELHAAAADVEHGAVGQRRRVDGGDVAVEGLLLAATAPRCRGRSARAPARGTPRGWSASRIALVATARTSSDAGGAAEVREHVDGPQRPLHGRGLELAGRPHPGPDAHGFVDLVDALPPPPPGGGEHHEPEGVRPEVDDRGAGLLGHPPATRARGCPRSARSGSRPGRARSTGGSRPRARSTAASRARCPAGQPLERGVEVVDRDGDVVVAGAELVGVDAVVVGQLEAGTVAGRPMKTLIASSRMGIRPTSSNPSAL